MQRLGVLGKAATAPTQTGIEEMGADAMIQTHDSRHLRNVGADALAQAAHFVDETDLGRQEGVAGVLADLGAGRVGGDVMRQVVRHPVAAGSRVGMKLCSSSGW